jgi:hypothetical protein
MSGGYDSEFEAEMLYHATAFEIVDNLLAMVADVSVKMPRSYFLPSCPEYKQKNDSLVPNDIVCCYSDPPSSSSVTLMMPGHI